MYEMSHDLIISETSYRS